MTVVDIVKAFAETAETAIVLTDAVFDKAGPTIRYANPAFCALTGFAREEIIGASPQQVQGKATSPLTIHTLCRALRAHTRFHGYVANYRKSGEAYLCELEVRPMIGRSGKVEHFIACEREVRRRRGRPGKEPHSRYAQVNAKAVFPGETRVEKA